LPVVKHVQDVVYLPVMNNDELKRAIMEYGSVVIGYKFHDSEIFFANGTYYASEVSPFNAIPIYSSHLVTLVGWDDNYPGSKFGENIPDGAFILKNSFGTIGYDKKLNVTYV
jgi:C1A family cysteine protease